jgi:hypothetical protein
MREAVAQQRRTRGKRARQSDEQPRAANEIEVKREEAADDRNEQHTAAHAGRHGDHSQHEADDEQRGRPQPPRRCDVVCRRRRIGRPCGIGARGKGAGGKDRPDATHRRGRAYRSIVSGSCKVRARHRRLRADRSARTTTDALRLKFLFAFIRHRTGSVHNLDGGPGRTPDG